MPLVPRFLRPPPFRIDDAPIDRGRRWRAPAEPTREIETRALPPEPPPNDEWDDVAFAPDSESRASVPDSAEAPCDTLASANEMPADSAPAEDAPAQRAPAPIEAEIVAAKPAELAAPQPVRFTAAHAGLPGPYAEKLRRSQAKDRFICDTLQLARLCWRKTCQRAGACRGDPRMCRFINGDQVPGEAHEWAELLAEADENGEPREALEADYPDEAFAFRCWSAALEARVRR
jgi:hypothetical protein